jgi:protoheme IX farnesyltransferase
MMPNVYGPDRTRLEILIYTTAAALAGFLPVALGFANAGYAAVAALLGAGFVLLAWRVFRIREGYEADRASRQLFAYSILYLFALFGALWVDHGFGLGR